MPKGRTKGSLSGRHPFIQAVRPLIYGHRALGKKSPMDTVRWIDQNMNWFWLMRATLTGCSATLKQKLDFVKTTKAAMDKLRWNRNELEVICSTKPLSVGKVCDAVGYDISQLANDLKAKPMNRVPLVGVQGLPGPIAIISGRNS